MIYPKTKHEIVQLILSEMKDNPDFPGKNETVDNLVFQWFATGRVGSGLRLTTVGSAAFDIAKIAHYDFDFTVPPELKKRKDWGQRYITSLSEKIKCPYYIGTRPNDEGKQKPFIRVYDHKIAMMLSIFGDLPSYIESLER